MIERRFSKSHEWIEVFGKVGTIGVTHYAQKELGEIVYIQLPLVGHLAKAGHEICVLESTKAASDVYSPVSGIVVAVNQEVADDPTLVNQVPEEKAWLFKIELSNPKELEDLLSLLEYEQFLL